jgi:predicted nuclease of restriction endonuclease-like (RecB) superfamily
LANDLRQAFPDLKGFSRTNLLYMRSFAENWADFEQNPIVQQAVGQIPWGHNLVLLTKLNEPQARLAHKKGYDHNTPLQSKINAHTINL